VLEKDGRLEAVDALEKTCVDVGNTPVCTENLIRVDDALETPKLTE
jgi:hypothetical protein